MRLSAWTPGSAAQERSFTVDVAGSGYDYYSTDESIRNGGAFTLTIIFTIEGSEVNAVSLELTNSAGSTTVQSVQRCR